MPLNITKKLGQHFLINQSAIQTIVAALELKKDETIIEIGPGEGALTLPLAEECQKIGCKLIGIEKDPALAKALEVKSGKLNIMVGDILKELPQLISHFPHPTSNIKIVGNIPYYITGKLMRVLSELKIKPSLIVLTIQKEVAERIAAKPPEMNLLAAATQFWAEPKIIGYLKPKDFSPPPKVESAILKLTPNNLLTPETNRLNYYKLIKIIFKQPRKTLLNNLVDGLGISKLAALEKLKKIGLPGQERPQNLNLKNIEYLANDVF